MAETCPTCGASDIPNGTLEEHQALHAPITESAEPVPHDQLPYPEKLAAYLEAWATTMSTMAAKQGATWAADIVRRSQLNPDLLNALPPAGVSTDINAMLEAMDADADS